MTTGSVVRAAAQLALLYAAIGVAGTLLLALVAGDLTTSLLVPLAVLVVALALAAAVIVALARFAVGLLEGRVSEPVVVAIMVASGVVLLSGFLTVGSLGVLSVAVSALMALTTHTVLTRCWA